MDSDTCTTEKLLCDLATDTKDPILLNRLAHSVFPSVRAAVAKNKNTVVSAIRILAYGGEPEVCTELALNLRTPISVLRRLARHQDSTVCISVARNPHTPLSVLRELSDHEDVVVRESAKSHGRMRL